MTRRAVIIHDLDHAVAALRVARTAGASVLLLSAAGAAGALGAPAFAALVSAARAAVPGADALFVLDCDDHPGHALAAFRAGIEAVCCRAGEPARGHLAEIAAASGSRLVEPPALALDLAGAGDPEAACHRWLA